MLYRYMKSWGHQTLMSGGDFSNYRSHCQFLDTTFGITERFEADSVEATKHTLKATPFHIISCLKVSCFDPKPKMILTVVYQWCP